MKNEYFNLIGQKAPGGKMILIAVVPDNLLGNNLPAIFEVQAIKLAPTIYTGTYPTIKINSETIKDRTEDLKGKGVAGIITGKNWYNVTQNETDIYGLELKP